MRWKELREEQKKPLDYKIEVAKQWIAEALKKSTNPAVAFSAGKDSTLLLWLIRQVCPGIPVLYGNTRVEFPQCVQFAHWLAEEWRLNFYETELLRTEARGYKYKGQQLILKRLVADGTIGQVLKPDGRLKSTAALERACPPDLAEHLEREGLIWQAGTHMTYWWCVDQFGFPLHNKAFSRLQARRINIDCFLEFSQSISNDEKLLRYYDVLRQVRVSHICCDILKKKPSEKLQQSLGVDLIFKGLMAYESRTRARNFLTRGYLFPGARKDYLHGQPFHHCQPLAIWLEKDVWEAIHRFGIPYSSLYDMTYIATNGTRQRIKRNGCMGCATDLLYLNNHLSILRQTHPSAWRVLMVKHGMAGEIRNLQHALRRNGQMDLFDVFSLEELIDRQPCVFDDLDGQEKTDEENTGKAALHQMRLEYLENCTPRGEQ